MGAMLDCVAILLQFQLLDTILVPFKMSFPDWEEIPWDSRAGST